VPDVMIGTFGKALGAFGAFAASTRSIAELLWNRARSFVFSTGLPPSVAASAEAAIQIVRSADGDALRQQLAAHARWLRAQVPRLGGDVESPIAPLVIGDDQRVMQLTAQLLDEQVFVQGIRPPTVPDGTARLRVSLSASHRQPHLERAATSLYNAMRQSL
jgi:7-keto-8-aminopelargonate synthetase-like enzyme